MADVVRKADYYYALVPNQVGAGAGVLAELAREGVGLLAFSGFPRGRRVQLDFVPEKPAALVKAAKKMKLKLSARKRCFLLQGRDRTGALVRVLEKLAKTGISVTALDAATAGGKRFGALFWVAQDDYAAAARVLRAR
jgi:hypothetical protein